MNIIAAIIIQLIIPLLLIIFLLYMRRRLHWKLLKRYVSDISGNIDISEKYNGEKVLMTNHFVQGVSIEKSSINNSYWYVVAENIIRHCENKKEARVLFIGLGANTSSLLINRNNPFIKQVIVEIDPLIVTACERFFHLKEMKNTEVIIADIYHELEIKKTKWREQFDVIVIDTFDARPPYLLSGSHDPKFLNPLYTWLRNDGMFVFNIPIKTQGIRVPSLLTYLKKIFHVVDHEIIYDPRGYRNHVIVASRKQK